MDTALVYGSEGTRFEPSFDFLLSFLFLHSKIFGRVLNIGNVTSIYIQVLRCTSSLLLPLLHPIHISHHAATYAHMQHMHIHIHYYIS